MAKIENTKTTVSLDADSKRVLRNLTKAIDRLSRSKDSGVGHEGVKRLTEPEEDETPYEGSVVHYSCTS